MLSQADPGVLAANNREAVGAVAELPAFEYLATPIRRRKALASTAARGLDVDNLAGRESDPKESAEVRAFIAALRAAHVVV